MAAPMILIQSLAKNVCNNGNTVIVSNDHLLDLNDIIIDK